MTAGRLLLIASCVLAPSLAPAGEGAPLTDTEVWNAGVELYRAGEVTNALAVLRPLMLSRSHGARAAEVVAKLEYDAAHKPGAADALKHLEESAAAAQIALRAAPDDPRANANFTRATDGLRELRETKRVNDILERFKQKGAESILQSSMYESRKLIAESGAQASGGEAEDAFELVRKHDRLASRASRLADSWYPVKETICQAVTNQAEAAEISARVDAVRAKTAEAATMLADMDDGARYNLAEAEQEFTDFFKMVAMPPTSMREDLVTQSNAWQDVAAECGRSWQQEALDYTRVFRARFPEWAQAYEQAAAADTNKPPFTAEAQAEISDLSTQLEKLQLECVKTVLPPKQEEAVGIIRRILELLPNDGQGGGQQNQQQDQKQGKSDQDKNEDQQQDQQPQDAQDQNDSQDREDEKKPDEAEPQPEPDEKSQDEKEMEAVLRKAQERNDEHEDDKKSRARKARLPPNERDW